MPPGGGPPRTSTVEKRKASTCSKVRLHFRLAASGSWPGGTFANMSVRTPHSFKNESDRPAKMLISVVPAALERMFFEVGQPVDEGATTAAPMTKEEIEKLLVVAPRYGIEIRLPHQG